MIFVRVVIGCQSESVWCNIFVLSK